MKIFCSIYEPETHPSPLKSIKSDKITSDGNPCKPNGKHIALYMIQENRSVTIFSSSLLSVTYKRRHQPASAYISFGREGKVNTELSAAPTTVTLSMLSDSIIGGKKTSATFILIAHLTANICRMEHSWKKKQLKRWKIAFCRAINLFCLPYTLRCVFSIYAARVLSRSENKQNERGIYEGSASLHRFIPRVMQKVN